jgi:2-oxoglutarate ferredoxin oxidoreductase subunit delta
MEVQEVKAGPTVQTPSRAAPRSHGRIFLLAERCKGCRFCVEFCPRQVLVMSDRFNSKGYHIPAVRAEERCTECKICELLCPEFAISVVRIEEGER